MDFEVLLKEVVAQAKELKDKHIEEKDAPINYAALFCQDDEEYKSFLEEAHKIGEVVEETPTGPLFKLNGVETTAGVLRILKVRAPDPTRTERGDADFTVSNYPLFKSKMLGLPEFKLIEREDYEMIELMDPAFNVRAYFSNPPLDQQLGIFIV